MLSLDIGTLARLSGTPATVISRMEKSENNIIDASLSDTLAIQAAFSKLGVDFIDGQNPDAELHNQRMGHIEKANVTESAKSILVADDDPLSRDILCRRLSRLGFAVTTAESGNAALSALATSSFHAVLLDGMMPDLPGIEVLQRLRSAKNHTRVIMVTGKALSSDIEQAMALGADGYITKPIDFKKLLSFIGDGKKC